MCVFIEPIHTWLITINLHSQSFAKNLKKPNQLVHRLLISYEHKGGIISILGDLFIYGCLEGWFLQAFNLPISCNDMCEHFLYDLKEVGHKWARTIAWPLSILNCSICLPFQVNCIIGISKKHYDLANVLLAHPHPLHSGKRNLHETLS